MKSEIERARVQGRIDTLTKAIDRIYDRAETEKRKLNSEEKQVAYGLEQEVKAAEAEIAERPLTVQNSRHNFRGGSGPFNTAGEFFKAVAMSARPGSQIDQRLYAATGLGESTPSEGGFLLQQDFNDQLLKGVYETGLLAGRCNRIQISGNSNSIKLPAVDESSRVNGSRWGGITSYWTSEAGEKIGSHPKFRSMELILHKMIGLCYATDELLADARALETVIRQGFQEELGFALDEAIYRGTGAGQPLGILNSGCLVTQAKETGQKADTVVLENIVKMYARMPARNRRNGVWLINQEIEPQLFTMSLSVGTGGSAVYLPGGGVSAAPYASLMGRPVVPIEQASALGDVGDICFADLNSYILCEKGGIESAMSIHVRYVWDESVFRFVLRVAGQPSWSSALTPYKGAGSLSPFVVLAERA